MEEVAFCEAKLLSIIWIGGMVVEGFDDLFSRVRSQRYAACLESQVDRLGIPFWGVVLLLLTWE